MRTKKMFNPILQFEKLYECTAEKEQIKYVQCLSLILFKGVSAYKY